MMESMYVTIVKMLLVIIVFAAVATFFYRYRDKFPNLVLGTPHKKTQGLQKVETVHLGYRKFVSVLEIKNRTLVVGIGDKEISLLAQWENQEKQS
jgi:flagellar biogenesis protein FliO